MGRVFISADIEGVTGVVNWAQCGGPDRECYDWAFARRMLTHDVNAAIRGARDAGATQILVKDSHGRSKNLLIDELAPGVELVSGFGSHPDGMMTGIDESFDAAMLIGYHAMGGTSLGIMDHTIAGFVHRLEFNGVPVGEMALSALVASAYGVPIVAVSSDAAGCAEAESFFPNVSTACVKHGLGRYMARCLHPFETGPMIERAAAEGFGSRKSRALYSPGVPVRVRVEFNLTNLADQAEKVPGFERDDSYSVAGEYRTLLEAHQAARAMISAGGLGAEAAT